MSFYDTTEGDDDYAEELQRERQEQRNTAKPYMFKWCEKCTLLKGCYYQHGERSSSPMFITEECGVGPSTIHP